MMFCQDMEKIHVTDKQPDIRPHLNTEGLRYTKSRKSFIRREEKTGIFRKKISFRNGNGIREKTAPEKLKKKVQ